MPLSEEKIEEGAPYGLNLCPIGVGAGACRRLSAIARRQQVYEGTPAGER